ncbi:MAG: DUF6785 family protein [Phycisphaeraceae bacterium]
MSIRALILGLLWGLLIAALTYFNGHVIRQTPLIGHHFPLAVFGVLTAGLLLLNPLLRRLGPGTPLRPAELALMLALALAACAWPGQGLLRTFVPALAMPSHMAQAEPSWQAAHVMSYIPGGSAELAPGHVRDWAALRQILLDAAADPPVIEPVRQALPRETQRALAAGLDEPDANVQRAVLKAINEVIRTQRLWVDVDAAMWPAAVRTQVARHEQVSSDREPAHAHEAQRLREAINRALLVHAMPEALAPAPRGGPVLPGGSPPDPAVTDPLTQASDMQWRSVGDLPWSAWRAPLLIWGGLALLLGLASLGMVLLVHPQWLRHEKLAYPLARFAQELMRPAERGALPAIARSQGFWIGMAIAGGIHLVNGLHLWFDWFFIHVPLTYPFFALMELFPNASVAPGGAWRLWMPTIYFSVLGLAYFLRSEVSLSLGVAGYCWIVFSALLFGQGVAMEFGTMILPLNFGAHLGLALAVLYLGRRYYVQAARSAAGLGRAKEISASATWGARLMVVCAIGAGGLLVMAGLDWLLASAFVVLAMLMLLVLTRVQVETGLFTLFAGWTPVAILTGLLGMEAIGPTSYLVLMLGSYVVLGGNTEALAPFLANAMAIGEGQRIEPRRAAPWLAVMVVASLLVAGLVTFLLQYNLGLDPLDEHASAGLPRMMFDLGTQQISELAATGTLADSVSVSGLGRLGALASEPVFLAWLAVGLVLAVGCMGLRLRLAWWPIHPVLFLVWGTWPIYIYGPAFLLGWAVKGVVIRFTGVRGYEAGKPVMVGLVAGELLAGLGWIVVGALYYLFTRQSPASYSIF